MTNLLNSMPLAEFSNLCRLCGSKTSVLMGLHIFEREGNLRQIYKKITECLPIQVETDDKLPKMVCEECVYKLDDLFEFRQRSAKTEYELNDMLKSLYICNDPMTIPMESLICDSTEQHSLKVPNGVQVDLNNGSLEGIMVSRLEDESVKCDSALLLKVNPIKSEFTLSHQQQAEFTADSVTPDSERGLAPDIDQPVPLPDSLEPSLHSIDSLEVVKSDIDVANRTDFVIATDGGWYFCEICDKPCNNGTTCDAHWKKCNFCNAQYTTEEGLLLHHKEAHSSDLEQVEKNDQQLSNNIKKDNSKTCLECGKEYRTNYKLAEHMRRHTGEKPFKCSTCDKTFRSKIGLAQHEAKHTGQYDYSCSTCGKGFQCKSYLIVHQRVHSDLKPYPCDTCGNNFKTKQSLLDHQNRHLGVKPYLCEICGRGFTTKGLCKSHQKIHSGTDNRQYPCQVCNKLFVSKSYLTTHLRIHTGEKPFMCEVCGKGFLTRVDLRIHSTMHTGEKSFVCEVCGKAFARRDALRCHRRSHTGERPYRCDICGQSFTQFSPMAIHKRLHTGERPYSCDICQKTFVSKSTMMSHRKKHGTS